MKNRICLSVAPLALALTVMAAVLPSYSGPIKIGAHGHTGSSSNDNCTVGTDCTVTLSNVKAGSSIVCEFAYARTGSDVNAAISDNVNTGNYSIFPDMIGDSAQSTGKRLASARMPNSLGGTMTITLRNGANAPTGAMYCQEWQNPAKLDGQFAAVNPQHGAATALTAGATKTPAQSGSLVIALAAYQSGTISAGTNFTLIEPGVTTSFGITPEYWIQTTPTATAGPMTNSSSQQYSEEMFALSPNIGQYCDANIIIDPGVGGSDGTPVSSGSALASSTFGLGRWSFPANMAANNTGANKWFYFTNTFSTPFDQNERCPNFSGKGAGTLGMYFDMSAPCYQSGTVNSGNCGGTNPDTNVGMKLYANASATGTSSGNQTNAGPTMGVSAFTVLVHYPTSLTAQTLDGVSIRSASGSANATATLHINSNTGQAGKWFIQLETALSSYGASSCTSSGTTNDCLSLDHKYGIRETAYAASGATQMLELWDCPNQTSGQACGITIGTTPTVTITGADATTNNPGPIGQWNFFTAANTFAAQSACNNSLGASPPGLCYVVVGNLKTCYLNCNASLMIP